MVKNTNLVQRGSALIYILITILLVLGLITSLIWLIPDFFSNSLQSPKILTTNPTANPSLKTYSEKCYGAEDSLALFNPEKLDVKPSPDGRTIRYRFVKPVLKELKDATKVSLNLFPDTCLVAVLDSVTVPSVNAYVWHGHVSGNEPGSVLLSAEGGVVYGIIRDSKTGTQYEVKSFPGGVHIVSQLDQTKFPPD